MNLTSMFRFTKDLLNHFAITIRTLFLYKLTKETVALDKDVYTNRIKCVY